MQKLITLLFLLAICCEASDKTFYEKEYKELLARVDKEEKEVALVTKGLVLAHKGAIFPEAILQEVEGVEIFGLDLPGGSEELKERLLPIFYRKALTMEIIAEIQQEVVSYYRAFDHPIVTVVVPEQDLSQNVLTLHVVEAKIGEVSFKGNEWFSEKRLLQYTRLYPGERIDSTKVMKQLFWLNRNPFRDSQVVLQPGEEQGTTDILFYTQDRIPVRPYAGIDNTGIKQTGRNRFLAGLTWGNGFNRDHIITYQYIASFHVDRFSAHTVHWTIPIQTLQHLLDFYGGYSKVKPKMPVGFRNEGDSWQISGRYILPFNPSKRYTHELSAGIDYKNTNNNLFFEEGSLIANAVQITQVVAKYTGDYHNDYNKTLFSGEIVWSPGDLFVNKNEANYEELRPFSNTIYAYFRGYAFTQFTLPRDFSASCSFQFQIANKNLLPTEEFGIGGYDTVRGYTERTLNFDNAFVVQTEFRTPPISFFHWNGWKEGNRDLFQFLVFLDYGVGDVHKDAPGILSSGYLLGMGPGIRYTITPYLNLRLDTGFKLHNIPDVTDWKVFRHHFSLIVNY